MVFLGNVNVAVQGRGLSELLAQPANLVSPPPRRKKRENKRKTHRIKQANNDYAAKLRRLIYASPGHEYVPYIPCKQTPSSVLHLPHNRHQVTEMLSGDTISMIPIASQQATTSTLVYTTTRLL